MALTARDRINLIAMMNGKISRNAVLPREFNAIAEDLKKHPSVQGGFDSLVRIDEKEYLKSYVMIGDIRVVPLCI